MYHHVCPLHEIPPEKQQARLEGWQYNIAPAAFEWQLVEIAKRGFRYVTFDEYLEELGTNRRNPGRLATVTFDDGWRDNFDYAFPILQAHSIPATFFIVSGEMDGVSRNYRMTPEQLCRLKAEGMTIGAHSRTHPNLALLSSQSLADELWGSKEDLEAMLGTSVNYLAYPGGRFNRTVVMAAQQAGFQAACSVIGWGQNAEASRYWLYRDVFSDRLDSLSDRLRLNAWSRRIFRWKASRALGRMLRVRTHE
ncbi:MAG: polysaccharide deacetylase family protein [Fuerstia sp.]|nr:polysaccharide deacetylase family protein [Fuerstiella sp.]